MIQHPKESIRCISNGLKRGEVMVVVVVVVVGRIKTQDIPGASSKYGSHIIAASA